MHSQRILQLSRLSLVALAVVLPVLCYWAVRLDYGTAFIESWLPGDDAARADYRAFRQDFGDDQFLLVSWPGCDINDARLPALSARLKEVAKSSPALTIKRVEDSSGMLQQLTAGPGRFTRAEALRRLSGFAIGSDGTSFIAVLVAAAPAEQRAALIDAVRAEAERTIDIGPDALILAGEPFQVYMIDVASRETMQYYVVPSSLMALVFAWCCLRNIRLTLLVFSIAGIGQVVGLALVSYFFGEMSAVLVVLPTLIFMLTLSAAIHLTNYYLDSGGHDQTLAGARALRLGAWPCLLATLTTVFGFASLAVSSLEPVWQFGSLAAGGLLLSSIILLTTFPAASQIGARRSSTARRSSALVARIENFLANVTERFSIPISILGLTLLAFAALGITRLGTSTEFDDMFSDRSRAIQNLRWVQEHVGPINSLEFLIGFDNSVADAEDSMLVRLALLERVQTGLQAEPTVHSTLSAMTFLPTVPTGSGAGNTIRRAVLKRMAEDNRGKLIEQSLLAERGSEELWRITVRVRDLRGDNYAAIRDQLLQSVERELAEFRRQQPSASVTQRLTGLRTVVEKAHFALLSDLGGSFVTAFVLITPVMMIIVRGLFSGLVLMVPNVLPVAFVFGCMGWIGVRLDVASILTASIALGIAVDDTLHFVSWFLRARRSGHTQADAVRAAIGACARPMFHTTVICTGAMLPFFFSEFLPTSKFAALMILILTGAIVGDLLLLPAILQTPLGRWVGPGSGKVLNRAAQMEKHEV